MRFDLAFRRSLTYLLPLALLFAALSMRVAASDLLERLSLICFDLYEKAAPRAAGDAPVRVVDIDDRSLRKIGQWPWPRAIVAELVDRLHEVGAAVIAFDIDFAEPDRTSPKSLLPLLAQNGVGGEEAERLLVALPDPDKRLAEAISALPIITGFILTDRAKLGRRSRKLA
jgi:adenylate cyclase